MIPTLYWERDAVMILDQRLLPGRAVFLKCTRMSQVIHAIQTLATRGAPAIGVAAAMGLVLGARAVRASRREAFLAGFKAKLEEMRVARPTAVNLSWACDRVWNLVNATPGDKAELIEVMQAESQRMLEEDIAINQAMGRHGAELVPQDARILTHCNAGSLATGGYGTALGVIRAAQEAGKNVSVIADETRPLLQGARLTAYEMVAEGIPVRVAADSAVGVLMMKGLVDFCVVGADRIAANGDTANKVGTFNVALQAQYHQVPFYVAAPLSTIDLATASGADIPIELRDPSEVTKLAGKQVAAPGADALNFAFDVTPHSLVTGIITEVGVLRPPYTKSIAAAKKAAGR